LHKQATLVMIGRYEYNLCQRVRYLTSKTGQMRKTNGLCKTFKSSRRCWPRNCILLQWWDSSVMSMLSLGYSTKLPSCHGMVKVGVSYTFHRHKKIWIPLPHHRLL